MGFLDDYEPVEDRLRQFWAEHPHGRIDTDLVHHAEGDYIFKASVFVAELHYLVDAEGDGPRYVEKRPDATGWAHDSVANLPSNMKASALEVCETSAIGRALANLGYAPKGKRPSREEMSKTSGGPGSGVRASSNRPPEDSSPVDPGELNRLSALLQEQSRALEQASEPHGRGAQPAGEEPRSINGEVAASAPSGSTIDAQTVKDLQAVLGGPTNALHAARARFGDSIHALKNLTTEQAKALLP